MSVKIKRVAGTTLLELLVKGDIDLALTYVSEVNNSNVKVVGPLPTAISSPTKLVGFVSAHAKSPDGARAVLNYLSSPKATLAYEACGMQAARPK